MLALTFDAVFKGELILFPTRVPYPEHPAKTAEALELAKRVGLHSIYLLITQIPSGKRTATTWNLKGICVRLNALFTVVSSKRKDQMLVFVSLYNPTFEWEKEALENG